MQKQFYVYIMTNKMNGTLYLGVSNDIIRRVHEHRQKAVKGFTARYGLTRLVYFEQFNTAMDAITREKQMKKWNRAWKLQLINEKNPEWNDLYDEIAA
ncbi:MAG: GIY-YIG nuclease family protein [Alphaproteobacteria bacterium]|nr:GIY-YIG nuclease family protein [Alphaproteobacteria bacterium]